MKAKVWRGSYGDRVSHVCDFVCACVFNTRAHPLWFKMSRSCSHSICSKAGASSGLTYQHWFFSLPLRFDLGRCVLVGV